jgi:hypothetical protein
LRRELGIDARASKKKQLPYSEFVGCLNYIVLNPQIIEEELDRKIVVRLDATDFCRSKNYDRRLFLNEKIAHRSFIGQIKLGSVALRQVIETFTLETADYRAARKTAMAGDEDFL